MYKGLLPVILTQVLADAWQFSKDIVQVIERNEVPCKGGQISITISIPHHFNDHLHLSSLLRIRGQLPRLSRRKEGLQIHPTALQATCSSVIETGEGIAPEGCGQVSCKVQHLAWEKVWCLKQHQKHGKTYYSENNIGGRVQGSPMLNNSAGAMGVFQEQHCLPCAWISL